jgi:hypothetical protein
MVQGEGLGKTRWRTFSWVHQFRKLQIWEERYPSRHEALMLIAFAVICLRFARM